MLVSSHGNKIVQRVKINKNKVKVRRKIRIRIRVEVVRKNR